MADSKEPAIVCWLLDTRKLWPGTKIDDSASEDLDLINQAERDDIRRKYRIQDARMSLGSALLKRYFVAKTLGVSWANIRFTRKGDPTHGKPCYVSSNGTQEVEFNVSHQAGLVALVGCKIPNLELGVDIVCVNERDEYRTINAEGFEGWIDIYQDIFSAEDTADMKNKADRFQLPDGTEIEPEMLGGQERCTRRGQTLRATLASGEERTFESNFLIDAKLRRFYTFWCYKEAYIKLVGEGLLAEWLQQLEFKQVRAPRPGTVWGEIVDDAEVWLHSKKQDDVTLQIQAFEEKFMLSVAAKPTSALPGKRLPSFTTLHLENDILDFAMNN